MGCQKCSLRNPLTWAVAFLAIPLLVFAGFLGFGLLSIFLTFSAMILSTVLFTSTNNNKPNLEEEDHLEQFVSDPQPESEPTTQEDADDFILRSSESECLDQSSSSTSEEEDSEAEWAFRDNVDHSPDWSDGSISDEESLIEIALPSGHYVDHSKKEEPNKLINLQQPRKFQDLVPQSILQQHSSLMELLAEINEMNEEDNLIEIDISMGSIKCSRIIGIKA